MQARTLVSKNICDKNISTPPAGTLPAYCTATGGNPVRNRLPPSAFQPASILRMTKYKLEYIWLDGYQPVPNLRGKTQIKEFDAFPTLEQLPLWGFDGCSTDAGRRPLVPIACSSRSRIVPDPAPAPTAPLVLCEVMMPDGVTPHATNSRATILDDDGAWFGFEQEYFFYKDGRPLGFPESRLSRPRRGPTTPASASRTSATVAREIVEKHLDICLAAGINHEGINAEVRQGPVGIPDLRQGLHDSRR